MKRRTQLLTFLLFLSFLCCFTLSSYAQVTIKSDASPDFTGAKFYTLEDTRVPTRLAPDEKDTGYIDPGDVCQVVDASGSTYWKVKYPIYSGYKTAYAKKTAILSNSNYAKKISISYDKTVYRRSDMKKPFGTVDTTEDFYMLTPISDGKAQIMYSITGGGYKIGWIYASTDADPPQTLTRGLYKNNNLSSKITCGYNGYNNTPGMHEGIDFARYKGATIYSLIDGEVIKVVEGDDKRLSSSLSSVYIYDETRDMTVIYLHLDPNIKEGTIKKGTAIGTESNRGKNMNTHTHVEVRSGRKETYAKSVSDYTLENPNPTPYWNVKGYIIQ